MKFRNRLSLWFGGLLVVSLTLMLAVIDRIATTTVLEQIRNSLSVAVRTVDKLHAQRLEDLQQKVRLVAADYGFKSAYSSGDVPTIGTALENHRVRLSSADLMVLADLDGLVIANTWSKDLNETVLPWVGLLDEALEEDSGEAEGFVTMDGSVYQLIVVPLLAPDIDAWVISGFRLDRETASELSVVTGSQISFYADMNGATSVVATTLEPGQVGELESQLPSIESASGFARIGLSGETHIGESLTLGTDSGFPVKVLVKRSLDEALLPFRTVERIITWVLMASILIAALIVTRLARNVTRSLSELSEAAGVVSAGNLDVTVPVTRNDEFGLLADSFNGMVTGLAEKEMVRDLLGKVVSPEIARTLIDEGMELGGEERVVSVLFCDLQGFTRLSEQQPASNLVTALNTFFSGAGEIIEQHGGVVDKYIGDAIMAVFGAPQDDPDHAQNAVKCGLALCMAATSLVRELTMKDGSRCGFGVGIHSGEVIAGNVGSKTRLNYTVIGDTVNVASRVEGQTRIFNVPLVVTEACASMCEGIEFRYVDEAVVKGRKKAIKIYTIPASMG